MTIDILCRVVDNYGDIGVMYRLARALTGLGVRPRLIVDDLASFRHLCPSIDPSLALQETSGMVVVASEDPRSRSSIAAEPPRFVVEGFACGRPEWYEALLFDESDSALRLIVDLEYLTAEDWAAEYHRLPSATRSGLVRKVMFMPGFSAGTGGLIQDRSFMDALSQRDADSALLRRGLLSRLPCDPLAAPSCLDGLETAFWVPVFTYDRDFSVLVEGFARFAAERPLAAFIAAGRSQEPFRAAWESQGRPFPAVFLPFLDQETWDALLLASDLSIVRGEDSFSRAVLAGRPFLWQVYRIDGGHHEPKAEALLELLRPRFSAESFAPYERTLRALCFREADGPASDGSFPSAAESSADVLAVLRRASSDDAFRQGFLEFSRAVRSVGDLARNLLTFFLDLR